MTIAIVENLEQVFPGGHIGMRGPLSDTVVNQDVYTVIKEIPTVFFAFGTLTFKAAAGDGNLLVRIWGDLGDFAYDQVVATEFLVTTGGAIVNKAFTGGVSAIRIEAKRQGSDAGTLSTTVLLTDIDTD